jgi:hypothetical protein
MLTSARFARSWRKPTSPVPSSWGKVPMPPGTSSRSSSGASSKACSASVCGPCAEATGPRCSATVTMRSSGPTLPNISSGP